MVFRERYAEIYRMGDTDYDHPLLKCGLRVRGRRMHLIVREDAANTGLTRLVLNSCVLDPTISQISQDIHTEYEGVYLTIDTISIFAIEQQGSFTYPTLNATWHNDTADVEITYGEPYAIDYWNGKAWINLTPPNMVFTLPGYLLSPGESREKEYSTLPFDMSRAGRYRLRCSFSIEDLPYKEWVKTQNNYETWVEFEISAKDLPEWTVETNSAIYGTEAFDLDGDGQIENIRVVAVPTSGLFSFRLTVQDATTGQQEYAGVFYSAAMELSLEQQDGKLYLCGTELNRGEEHRYDVTMKDGVVSITEGGVPIGGTVGE
jgi:hypothetical protein